jgi:hypothetical protein
LLLYLSHLALGVSNWPVIYFINYTPTSSLALFITAPLVTDVLDPLSDTGSDYSESSDFCPMVEVLALEDDGGGDLPRSTRPSLERPPPQE